MPVEFAPGSPGAKTSDQLILHCQNVDRLADGGLASISSTRDIRALAMLPPRCAWRSSTLAKASKKAGGKEVRHRLLLDRLGSKPDKQSTLNHHFFSTRWLPNPPKWAEPHKGSRSGCIGRIANFDTDSAIRSCFTARMGEISVWLGFPWTQSLISRQKTPPAPATGC
jgi:hypothetical protein